MPPAPLTFDLPLPQDYLAAPVLAFHARDPLQRAERVGPGTLAKGLMLAGIPTVLELRLEAHCAHVRACFDQPAHSAAEAAARRAAERLLGLRTDPGPLCRAHAADPLLGPLLARRPGLRIAQAGSLFEALTWAIIGQQIHVGFAVSLRSTLLALAGTAHSSGLLCYPEPQAVARLGAQGLEGQRFSRAKARALEQVARLACSDELPLQRWEEGADADAEATLLAITGVGPWTVNYALLRGAADPDRSLHGDVAVRSALQRGLGLPGRPDAGAAAHLLAAYRPHRSLVAAHLWQSLHDTPVAQGPGA